jgi:superfamily I DNA/RNA helicase
MEKHYPEVKVIKLEQNYRSPTPSWMPPTPSSSATPGGAPKGCGRTAAPARKSPCIPSVMTRQRHARWSNISKPTASSGEFPGRIRPFCFATNLQSRPLETALRQGAVRYNLIGGQSYFDRREIRDFVAYLKTFLNPHDDVSLLRIANVPARGLSEATMERLLAASHEREVLGFLCHEKPGGRAGFQTKARDSIDSFVQLVERTMDTLSQPTLAADPHGLQHWAERFLDETGYLADLKRSEKTAEAGENRVRSLRDLSTGLDGDDLSVPGTGRLEKFLDDISLETDRNDEEESAGNAVTLITMHSCKGLEFPTCTS